MLLALLLGQLLELRALGLERRVALGLGLVLRRAALLAVQRLLPRLRAPQLLGQRLLGRALRLELRPKLLLELRLGARRVALDRLLLGEQRALLRGRADRALLGVAHVELERVDALPQFAHLARAAIAVGAGAREHGGELDEALLGLRARVLHAHRRVVRLGRARRQLRALRVGLVEAAREAPQLVVVNVELETPALAIERLEFLELVLFAWAVFEQQTHHFLVSKRKREEARESKSKKSKAHPASPRAASRGRQSPRQCRRSGAPCRA